MYLVAGEVFASAFLEDVLAPLEELWKEDLDVVADQVDPRLGRPLSEHQVPFFNRQKMNTSLNLQL